MVRDAGRGQLLRDQPRVRHRGTVSDRDAVQASARLPLKLGEDPPHSVTGFLLGVGQGTRLRPRPGRERGSSRRGHRIESVTNCQGITVGGLLAGHGDYDMQLAAGRHPAAEPELGPRQPTRQVDDQRRIPRARQRRLGHLTRPCRRRNHVKVAPIENAELSRPPAPRGERPEGGRAHRGLVEFGEHASDRVHRPRRSPGAVSQPTARPRKHAADHRTALHRRQRLHARSGKDRPRPVGDETRQRRKAHTHQARISEPAANGDPGKSGGHGDIDRRHRVAAADVSQHVTQCGERRPPNRVTTTTASRADPITHAASPSQAPPATTLVMHRPSSHTGHIRDNEKVTRPESNLLVTIC